MKRQIPSATVQLAILAKSRRRCSLCFHFDSDLTLKDGQIAHIDNNNENSVESNLVYLCLRHHDIYHKKSPLSKSITPEELKFAKSNLENWIAEHLGEISDFGHYNKIAKNKIIGITPVIYQLRLPIYNTLREFIVQVLREARVTIDQLFKYSYDTHDALFLFGNEIETYCRGIFGKAVELRAVQVKMDSRNMSALNDWETLVQKETDLLILFDRELNNLKNRFYPYLKLKGD
jgi:hypothetical protein